MESKYTLHFDKGTSIIKSRRNRKLGGSQGAKDMDHRCKKEVIYSQTYDKINEHNKNKHNS